VDLVYGSDEQSGILSHQGTSLRAIQGVSVTSSMNIAYKQDASMCVTARERGREQSVADLLSWIYICIMRSC
jgi:hypothetical protein